MLSMCDRFMKRNQALYKCLLGLAWLDGCLCGSSVGGKAECLSEGGMLARSMHNGDCGAFVPGSSFWPIALCEAQYLWASIMSLTWGWTTTPKHTSVLHCFYVEILDDDNLELQDLLGENEYIQPYRS